MPKHLPPIAPIIMVVYTPRFEAADYSVALDGPYDITVPLQSLQQQAGAKGCGVVVNISLIPYDELFPPEPIEDQENSND